MSTYENLLLTVKLIQNWEFQVASVKNTEQKMRGDIYWHL